MRVGERPRHLGPDVHRARRHGHRPARQAGRQRLAPQELEDEVQGRIPPARSRRWRRCSRAGGAPPTRPPGGSIASSCRERAPRTGTALKATDRPRSQSRASNTTPKPPRPISFSISNRPTTTPAASSLPFPGSGGRIELLGDGRAPFPPPGRRSPPGPRPWVTPARSGPSLRRGPARRAARNARRGSGGRGEELVDRSGTAPRRSFRVRRRARGARGGPSAPPPAPHHRRGQRPAARRAVAILPGRRRGALGGAGGSRNGRRRSPHPGRDRRAFRRASPDRRAPDLCRAKDRRSSRNPAPFQDPGRARDSRGRLVQRNGHAGQTTATRDARRRGAAAYRAVLVGRRRGLRRRPVRRLLPRPRACGPRGGARAAPRSRCQSTGSRPSSGDPGFRCAAARARRTSPARQRRPPR